MPNISLYYRQKMNILYIKDLANMGRPPSFLVLVVYKEPFALPNAGLTYLYHKSACLFS